MPKITGVAPGSIADEGGVLPGDELISINGETIADIFDYRYHSSASELEVLLRDAGGEECVLEIEKEEDEDLGLSFEGDLLGETRACSNRCVFCFIDQLPPGLRPSLYFKDDDFRQTLVNGNYTTLTNIGRAELDRIARYRLSPINVSVHTTDAALRAKMLGFESEKKARFDIMPKLKFLTISGVTVNAQIVLCKGYNDGAALDSALGDLGGLNRHMQSVSVVPSGLTRHRDGLPALSPFDGADAGRILERITGWQKEFQKKRGGRFVFAADEFYLLAGKKVPGHGSYEGYPQLENGVGMLALFKKQFSDGLAAFIRKKGRVSERYSFIVTGAAAAPLLEQCAAKTAAAFPGVRVKTIAVTNRFFGETITVAGLITGVDIFEQLKHIDFPENSRVFIPKTMLKYGTEVFLDDFTLEMLRSLLKVDIIAVENNGRALARALTRD